MQAMKSHEQEFGKWQASSEHALIPLEHHTNSVFQCSCGGPTQEMGSEGEILSTLLLLFSHTLTNWDCAQILFSCLAKNRKTGSCYPSPRILLTPRLQIHSSLWRLILRVTWCPTPIFCATYHWEPSGLLAKSQAHLPPSHLLKDKCLLFLAVPPPTRSQLEPSVIIQMLSSKLTKTSFLRHPSLLLIPVPNSHFSSSPNILSTGFPPATLRTFTLPLGCQGQTLHPRVSSESFLFFLSPWPFVRLFQA